MAASKTRGTRTRSTSSAKKATPKRWRRPALLIGTIKGAFILETDDARKDWKLRGPYFLGSRINDLRLDPRDGKTLLCSVNGGHLGPSLQRSTDRGRTWTECAKPPKFMKAKAGAGKDEPLSTRGASVKINFWLEPGHAEEPDAWYLGTSPVALFKSADGGLSWKEVKGFNHHPMWADWTYKGDGGTPDGSVLHSIQVDPRDKRHLYISASGGGTFESNDQGKSWAPLNKGVAMDFWPGPPREYGHDPHCMIVHPADPDRLYQQNHCGIYRLDRDRGEEWDRIGKKMPKKIGDIGFPMVPHPTDPDTVWVFPMDGTRVWPRVSPGGKPAVYRTTNGGKSWERLDAGLPQEHAYMTVKRQAMCADDDPKRPGVYFGTTGGELWCGSNGGQRFRPLLRNLPHIYSVRWCDFR